MYPVTRERRKAIKKTVVRLAKIAGIDQFVPQKWIVRRKDTPKCCGGNKHDAAVDPVHDGIDIEC